MKRTKIADVLSREDYGATVVVKGWVRTRRGSKSVNFVALNDGSTIRNVQVVADVEKFDAEVLRQITTGACLSVTGTLVQSVGAGQSVEIQADAIEILGTCGSDYPMQKKGQSSDTIRHLPTFGCVPTRSARFSAYATTWRWPSTATSTNTDSSIFILPSSPPATVKVPDRCFK